MAQAGHRRQLATGAHTRAPPTREVTPGETAIVTVGSVQAGTRSNVIPDHAVLQLNVRSYDVLLDAFALRLTQGHAVAAPALARALG